MTAPTRTDHLIAELEAIERRVSGYVLISEEDTINDAIVSRDPELIAKTIATFRDVPVPEETP